MTQPAEIDQKEAHERLQRGDADIYLDVRSTPEFQQGHPAGAWHVPLFDVDPGSGMMRPNQDFMKVVKVAFQPEQRILVGCRTGHRSRQAATLMLQEGFTDVANVDGGFAGQHDAFGRKTSPSWADLELPVESGDGGERSYAVLRAKA